MLCLPAVFFWRATLGTLTLGHADVIGAILPLQEAAFAQWRSGSLPLWNPYIYGGVPLLAHLQAGVFDPLNSFFWWGVTGRVLTLVQEAAFALALTGMFAFMRSLGLRRRACLIAAIIYGLSGFNVARSIYAAMLHALALLPWILWALERLRQTGRWRYVAWGGLLVAWQGAAGHPQTFVYSTLLVMGYAWFCGWKLRAAQASGRFALQWSWLMALGLLTAAAQWLPAWEVARASVRQAVNYDFYTANSLHPLTLFNTLIPYLHGQGSGIFHLPFWGDYWTHNEAQFYVGVLALAWLGGALVTLRGEATGQVKFWSVVALVSLLCALGGSVPPLAAVLSRLPLLGSFRSPNRHWMEWLCACAVLSGFAVNAVIETAVIDDARVLRRVVMRGTVILTGLCGLLAVVFLGFRLQVETLVRSWPRWNAIPQGFLQKGGAEFVMPVLIAGVATTALWFFLRQPASRWRYCLLLAVWLADYQAYAYFAPLYSLPQVEAGLGRAFPPELASSPTAPSRTHLFLPAQKGEFAAYWFAGHEMLTGYDPLLNHRFKAFTGINEVGQSERQAILSATDRTLDLLNVHYLLMPQAPALKEPSLTLDAARWKNIPLSAPSEVYGGWQAYENLQALPYAWLVNHVKVLRADEQLACIGGAVAFDPRQTALLEPLAARQLEPAWLTDKPAAPATHTARLLVREPSRLVIETETERPMLLVISEIDSPGWVAAVDSRPMPIWRANYLLRSVAVPAGKHRVTMSYEPMSLRWGLRLSLSGLLGILVFFLIDRPWLLRFKQRFLK